MAARKDMPPQGKAPKMAPGKNAQIPMERSGGSPGSLTKPSPIPFWVQNEFYNIGQQVIFENSIYYAKLFIPAGFPFSTDNFKLVGTFPGNTVVVAKTGGDYDILADALADPIIQGASASNLVAILMYSGIYDEEDFTVPAFVELWGIGHVHLRPTAVTTSVFCTLEVDSTIQDIHIIGNGNAAGAGAIGIKLSAGVTTIRRVAVEDFNIGYEASGANVILVTEQCDAQLGTNAHMVTGFSAISGASITASASNANGNNPFSKMPIAFSSEGSGSSINTIGGSAVFSTQAVVLNNSSGGTINSLSVVGADEAFVQLNGTGPTNLTVLNPSVDSTTALHHNLLDNNVGAKFEQSGGVYDSSKVIHSDNITLRVNTIDENENDEGLKILGEINHGSPARGSEANFGGGDSTTLGMIVQTNTNGEIGVWVDQTDNSASASGSTVTMFPALIAESTIYFGRSAPFGGFKLIDLSVLMVLGGSGAIVFEFWNGATWQSITIMETDSTDLEDVRANSVFVTNVDGDLELRIGDTAGWVTKSLDSITKYWLRIRITTAITTAPVFQQSKLHSDSFQVNADGQIQLKGGGRAQFLRALPRLEDLSGFASGNSSVNANTNTNILVQNNNRAANAKDGSGIAISLNSGVDTSFPMQVLLKWAPGGAGTGDVENSIAVAKYTTGSVLDGTISETTVDVIRSIDNQEDEVQEDSFSFDISDALPGSNINIGIFRDATAGNLNDTLPNPIYIIGVEVVFKTWR